VAGWGVAPSLDLEGIFVRRDPPTLTLPRKGGGDIIGESGIGEPNVIALPSTGDGSLGVGS
jgi:hypothetical protein